MYIGGLPVPLQAQIVNLINPELLTLLFNGTNGSTSFIDSSPFNRTLTGFGNAQISTAQSVSGGSSLSLPDANSYIDFVWNTPLVGDFTLTVDIRPDAVNIDQDIFVINNPNDLAGNFQLEIDGGNGQIRSVLGPGVGTYFDFNSTVSVVAGVFTNVKLIVAGTTATIFINGVPRGSASFSGTRIQALTRARVGRLLNIAPIRNFVGYIDNLTITVP